MTTEIARMEEELQERHKQELLKPVQNRSGLSEEVAELEGEMRGATLEGEGVEEDGKKAVEQEKTGKKSRAQKRRVNYLSLTTLPMSPLVSPLLPGEEGTAGAGEATKERGGRERDGVSR